METPGEADQKDEDEEKVVAVDWRRAHGATAVLTTATGMEHAKRDEIGRRRRRYGWRAIQAREYEIR